MDTTHDLIATLEQENRQLHARNQRLEKELEAVESNAVTELRDKLDMEDEDKFKAFRLATKLVAECFKKNGTKGVLLTAAGDKITVVSMNAEIKDLIEMTGSTCERLLDAMQTMQDENRVLN